MPSFLAIEILYIVAGVLFIVLLVLMFKYRRLLKAKNRVKALPKTGLNDAFAED